MEQGAKSGTHEYAEALEEAFSGRDDEIEDCRLMTSSGGTLFTNEELPSGSPRLRLPNPGLRKDAAFISEYAETILRAAVTGFL